MVEEEIKQTELEKLEGELKEMIDAHLTKFKELEA